jgi:drug/metabolite transporter (DMT)-like permease
MKPTRVFVLTLTAMIAFAGNSLLCRAALRQTGIDPGSFTLVRILSGALALWLICNFGSHAEGKSRQLAFALALFAYAAAFSLAYNTLSAGTGALLLFGAVQATMILWGLRKGEGLHARQFIGLALAAARTRPARLPGLSAPSLGGSALMLGAGVAWGIYSLRGKGAGDPISATAGNFFAPSPSPSSSASPFFPGPGSIAPGWPTRLFPARSLLVSATSFGYTVLPSLKAASAATVQLSVPVLAASGGILLLGEPLTLRFWLAAGAVLGGIALVVLEKRDAA